MEEIITLWSIVFLLMGGGLWYIKEGYHYGFIEKKFKKSKFHIGDDDDDYLYGKAAIRMGTFQILGGIIMFLSSGYLLYAYYILGIVKM
jgi:hypothetical protein